MNNRLFNLVGILSGLLWIWLNLNPAEFGYPGSYSYQGYELWNRLWPLALIGMGFGFHYFFKTIGLPAKKQAGIRLAFDAGFTMMVIGNVSEFWFFSDLPYGTLNLRVFSWILFLLGFLTVLIASAVFGFSVRGKKGFPQWLVLEFIATFALSLVLFFVDLTWAFALFGALSVAVGWLGFRKI